MATPHVAGAFALLKSAKPAASVDEAFTVLQSTGVPLTDGRSGIVKPLIQVGSAGAPDVVVANLAPTINLTSPAKQHNVASWRVVNPLRTLIAIAPSAKDL